MLILTVALFVGVSIFPSTSFAYINNDFDIFETGEGLDILGPEEEVLYFGIEEPQETNHLSHFGEEDLDILGSEEKIFDFGIEAPQETNDLSHSGEEGLDILGPGEEILYFGIEPPTPGPGIALRSSIGTIRYAGGGHTGGTIPAQHTLNVPGSATLRQSGTLVRSGHTFAGWRSSSSGNVFAGGATVVFSNPGIVTYTAVWNANNNIGTIRYAGGGHTGGTVPAQHTLNVPGSATLRQPGTMVRSGHTFAGWRSSSSGNVFAGGATVVFSNPGIVTYTAVWNVNNNIGTIRYAGGGHTGGTVPAQHTLNVPGSATLRQPGTMVRSGHTFAGWRSSSSGNVFAGGATVVFNNPGTVTYTAVWRATASPTPPAPTPPLPILSVDPNRWRPGPFADSTVITVRSNLNWSATTNTPGAWLRVTNGSGTGNGTFTISVVGNGSNESRTGTVFISAPGATTQSITVTQARAFIWHSQGADSDMVGFWPGAITVHTQILGTVSTNFRFPEAVMGALNEWSRVLPVTIGTNANSANAQIRARGGTAAQLGEVREGGWRPNWAGYADPAISNPVRTISVGGRNRTVRQFSGQAQIWVEDRVWSTNAQETRNIVRNIATHELGHALGFWGHSNNSQDVMWHEAHARFTLSPNEARHLSQIYEVFR